VLYDGLCTNGSARPRAASIRCARNRVGRRMTASEYVFAVAMTLLIVWLVAEISVTGPLKGPGQCCGKPPTATDKCFRFCCHAQWFSRNCAAFKKRALRRTQPLPPYTKGLWKATNGQLSFLR